MADNTDQKVKSTDSTRNTFDYSKTDLVIYHGGCPDGVAGAWCFWTLLNKDESKFHAGKFKETPPDVTGKRVVFVDFSYSEEIIKDMLSKAASVRILDHHKSALPLVNITADNYSTVIDISRSGAHIAWDELYGDDSGQGLLRPWFIKDIGDRDLWAWKQVGSVDTCMAMYTLKYYESFTAFDTIRHIPREYFVMVGNALNAKNKKTIDNTVARAVDCIATSLIDPTKTWKVRVVECDHDIASEVGNKLVLDGLCDFSIMFRYNVIKDEWWCSARADQDRGVDLTAILKHFDPNAGGHAAAAGFSLSGGKSLRAILSPANGKFADMQYAANGQNVTNTISKVKTDTETKTSTEADTVVPVNKETVNKETVNKETVNKETVNKETVNKETVNTVIHKTAERMIKVVKSMTDTCDLAAQKSPDILNTINDHLLEEMALKPESMSILMCSNINAIKAVGQAIQKISGAMQGLLENSKKILIGTETALKSEKINNDMKLVFDQYTESTNQSKTQPPGGPSIEQ